MTTWVGIDYSMTCPSICIHKDRVPETNDLPLVDIYDCTFHVLTAEKKYQGTHWNGRVVCHPLEHMWTSDEQRYQMISDWALKSIGVEKTWSDEFSVCIEGYSMGSKGRVFNIAENCGLLKHMLWKSNVKFQVAPPTSVKMWFTGKGNADKTKMVATFIQRTGQDPRAWIGYTKASVGSPVADIVDSYAMMCYGRSVSRK